MKTKFTFLLAAGLFLAIVSQAQYHDNYGGQRDIRHDRDFRNDRKEVYQDRQNLNRDYNRDYNYEYPGAYYQDRRDLIRDRRDLYFDRHDRRFNHRRMFFMRHREIRY